MPLQALPKKTKTKNQIKAISFGIFIKSKDVITEKNGSAQYAPNGRTFVKGSVTLMTVTPLRKK